MSEQTPFNELIENITQNKATAFSVVENLDSEGDTDGKKLVIEQRELQPEEPIIREIDRAAKRGHIFYDVGRFCDYLNREANIDRLTVLMNPHTYVAAAVLDEDDAQDRELIELRLSEHTILKDWRSEIFDRQVDVLQFAKFVMRHRRCVVDPPGRELAMLFSQVTMSKAVNVERGQGAKAVNGIMCTVEISGQKQSVPVELPEMITVRLPLFIGDNEEFELEVDLLVEATGDDSVAVFATASGLDDAKAESMDTVLGILRSGLNHDEASAHMPVVALGEVRNLDWNYVGDE